MCLKSYVNIFTCEKNVKFLLQISKFNLMELTNFTFKHFVVFLNFYFFPIAEQNKFKKKSLPNLLHVIKYILKNSKQRVKTKKYFY